MTHFWSCPSHNLHLHCERKYQLIKFSIAKNSEEEALFIKDILSIIKNLDVSNLSDINNLEDIVNIFVLNTEHI